MAKFDLRSAVTGLAAGAALVGGLSGLFSRVATAAPAPAPAPVAATAPAAKTPAPVIAATPVAAAPAATMNTDAQIAMDRATADATTNVPAATTPTPGARCEALAGDRRLSKFPYQQVAYVSSPDGTLGCKFAIAADGLNPLAKTYDLTNPAKAEEYGRDLMAAATNNASAGKTAATQAEQKARNESPLQDMARTAQQAAQVANSGAGVANGAVNAMGAIKRAVQIFTP